MFRAVVALIAVLALTAIATTAVEARSVNIHGRTITVTATSTDFTIGGKVTGLAGGFTYQAEVSGTIEGDYQCHNPGGNDPPPKHFETDVIGSDTFVAQNNGTGFYSVETEVPTPPVVPNCTNGAGGWSVQLVSYSGTVDLEICDAVSDGDGGFEACGAGAGEAQVLDSVSGIAVSFP